MTAREMLREVAYRLDNYAAKLDTDDGAAKFKYAAALRALAARIDAEEKALNNNLAMDELRGFGAANQGMRSLLARLDADLDPALQKEPR